MRKHQWLICVHFENCQWLSKHHHHLGLTTDLLNLKLWDS